MGLRFPSTAATAKGQILDPSTDIPTFSRGGSGPNNFICVHACRRVRVRAGGGVDDTWRKTWPSLQTLRNRRAGDNHYFLHEGPANSVTASEGREGRHEGLHRDKAVTKRPQQCDACPGVTMLLTNQHDILLGHYPFGRGSRKAPRVAMVSR